MIPGPFLDRSIDRGLEALGPVYGKGIRRWLFNYHGSPRFLDERIEKSMDYNLKYFGSHELVV